MNGHVHHITLFAAIGQFNIKNIHFVVSDIDDKCDAVMVRKIDTVVFVSYMAIEEHVGVIDLRFFIEVCYTLCFLRDQGVFSVAEIPINTVVFIV